MKKQITTTTPNGRLQINISTYGCGGRSYFSITADEYENGRHVACGCLHDEILKVRPDLKFLVDIHLADMDGVPMYAEANGWYWLAKAAGIDQTFEPDQSIFKCAEIFASHVRTGDEYAEFLIDKVREAYDASTEDLQTFRSNCARAVWKQEMEKLRPLWKSQAHAALVMIKKMA